MSQEFYNEIDSIFGDILKIEEKEELLPSKIKVIDVKTGKPVEGINYSRMLFDNQLNMYKISEDGKGFVLLKSKNFKAVLID